MKLKVDRRRSFAVIAPLMLVVLSFPALLSPSSLPVAHATGSTGLGIWSQGSSSNAVVNATITTGSLLKFRVNASGGVPINAFDITVRWDPSVLNATGFLPDHTGGIFDTGVAGDYIQVGNCGGGPCAKNDYVEIGAALLLTPSVKANGTLFTFTVKVKAIGSTAISFDTSLSHILLGSPPAIPYTPLNGYFSNSPGTGDLTVSSVSVPKEVYDLGSTIPISFAVRNVGSIPMAAVNVTLYANSTQLNITRLGIVAPNSVASGTFIWATSSGFVRGVYNLTATVVTSTPDAFSGDNRLSLEMVQLVVHDLKVLPMTLAASIPDGTTLKANTHHTVLEKVQNIGTSSDYANASIYANNTLITSFSCTSTGCTNSSIQRQKLNPGQSWLFQFNWTTNLPVGTYLIEARVAPPPNEINPANNKFDIGYASIVRGFVHDLSIQGTLPNVPIVVGNNQTLTVTIGNGGSSTDSYVVYLLVDGNVVTQVASTQPIAPNATQSVTVIWRTLGFPAGIRSVELNVTIVGAVDEYPSDNYVGPGGVTLSSNLPPIARFTSSPSSPLVGDVVTFNASASNDPDGSVKYYIWDFGDNSTATTVSPTAVVTHTYNAARNYVVKLTVWDDLGAQGSNSTQITVTAPSPAGTPILEYVAIGVGVAAVAIAALLLVRRRRVQKPSPIQATKKT